MSNFSFATIFSAAETSESFSMWERIMSQFYYLLYNRNFDNLCGFMILHNYEFVGTITVRMFSIYQGHELVINGTVKFNCFPHTTILQQTNLKTSRKKY